MLLAVRASILFTKKDIAMNTIPPMSINEQASNNDVSYELLFNALQPNLNQMIFWVRHEAPIETTDYFDRSTSS